MKAIAEFTPFHLEKAVDMARHIATFARLEFSATYIRMRIVDPAKVVHLDMILTPTTYKCDGEFNFGINLQMFYKLFRSLNNNETVEIEVDDNVMKINQVVHYHYLVSHDIPVGQPEILDFTGPKVRLPTKTLQKYIRALGNIAPAVELHYVPASDTLFLESVNSMYRTLFSVDTSATPNSAEEYRAQFMIKFLEMGISTGLAETLDLTMGEKVVTLFYDLSHFSVLVTVAAYTEG